MQNGCIILIQEARCNKKLTNLDEKFCFSVTNADVRGLPSGGPPPLASPPKLRGILPLKPLVVVSTLTRLVKNEARAPRP